VRHGAGDITGASGVSTIASLPLVHGRVRSGESLYLNVESSPLYALNKWVPARLL
jgi:hypothetical protein